MAFLPKYHAREENRQNAMLNVEPKPGKNAKYQEPNDKNQKNSSAKSEAGNLKFEVRGNLNFKFQSFTFAKL